MEYTKEAKKKVADILTWFANNKAAIEGAWKNGKTSKTKIEEQDFFYTSVVGVHIAYILQGENPLEEPNAETLEIGRKIAVKALGENGDPDNARIAKLMDSISERVKA